MKDTHATTASPTSGNDYAGDPRAELAEKMKEALCPHCSKPLGINLVAQLLDESRMAFTITPKEGAFLNARTVAGTLQALERLLASVGKEMGYKTITVVEGVSSSNGEITVDLLLSNLPMKEKRK